jgi:hypothetical protein
MKNYILVSFFISSLFCTKDIVAATSICRDTIPPAALETEFRKHKQTTTVNEQPQEPIIEEQITKEPTMTDEEAADDLIIAKDCTRKAKNALIFSIPTFGVFYPLALYWLIAALGPAIRARRHYRSFSKNKTLIREAENTYQTAITLLIIHALSLFTVLLVTNYGNFSSFEISDVGGLSVFSVFLAALADFFVFNLFIPNKWKKKK